MKNCYEILGVSPDATTEQIRTAYRALARRLHPDLGGNTEAAFEEATKAYRLLSDPLRRGALDAELRAAERKKTSRTGTRRKTETKTAQPTAPAPKASAKPKPAGKKTPTSTTPRSRSVNPVGAVSIVNETGKKPATAAKKSAPKPSKTGSDGKAEEEYIRLLEEQVAAYERLLSSVAHPRVEGKREVTPLAIDATLRKNREKRAVKRPKNRR